MDDKNTKNRMFAIDENKFSNLENFSINFNKVENVGFMI